MITIPHAALLKATKPPRIKASPRPRKYFVPPHTVIDGRLENHVIITAPAHRSILDVTGKLGEEVTVHALNFYTLISKLPKSAPVTLEISGDCLMVSAGSLRISHPLLPTQK